MGSPSAPGCIATGWNTTVFGTGACGRSCWLCAAPRAVRTAPRPISRTDARQKKIGADVKIVVDLPDSIIVTSIRVPRRCHGCEIPCSVGNGPRLYGEPFISAGCKTPSEDRRRNYWLRPGPERPRIASAAIVHCSRLRASNTQTQLIPTPYSTVSSGLIRSAPISTSAISNSHTTTWRVSIRSKEVILRKLF